MNIIFKKKIKTATYLIVSVPVVLITASFFMKQIFEIFNIHESARNFIIIKNGFLGMGIFDLLTLPLKLKLIRQSARK